MKNRWSTPSEWFGRTESGRPASQLAVLDYVWGREEFTATDVMEGTGLTRATAIDALGRLADAGLVLELANVRQAGEEKGGDATRPGGALVYRKGRPARRFAFRPQAGVVVGVDAGYTHLSAIAADLAGTTLASVNELSGWEPETRARPVEALAEGEADKRREAVRSLVSKVLRAAGRTERELFAVCVGVPAPVNESGDSPSHHAGFWERVNPGLLDALSDLAPIVRIENDALLAAVAEGAVGAARGCASYVAVLGGARMGTGVVIDGKLLRGAHGAVGEMNAFEHVVGVGDSRGFAEYAGLLGAKLAAAGEAASGGEAVAGDAVGPTPGGAFDGLSPEEVTGRLVFEAIEAGDPDALVIAAQVGERLARIVTVLESFYDPERIVVSGAVGPAMLRVIEAARAAMPHAFESIVPELVGSELGAEAVVVGAVAAAVEMARSRALDIAG